jgi:hypothetical protein
MDFYAPTGIKLEIPHGDEPASERCSEMVLKAMREQRSPTAKENYLAAAQWFALSVQPQTDYVETVTFGELSEAQPKEIRGTVRRLSEVDSTIEGVLLGPTLYGLILLRSDEGACCLQGHKDLWDQLDPLPIGTYVKITLVRVGGQGKQYLYEVET